MQVNITSARIAEIGDVFPNINIVHFTSLQGSNRQLQVYGMTTQYYST